MQLSTLLYLLSLLSTSVTAQNFHGSPGSGPPSGGQTLRYPDCAVRLVSPRLSTAPSLTVDRNNVSVLPPATSTTSSIHSAPTCPEWTAASPMHVYRQTSHVSPLSLQSELRHLPITPLPAVAFTISQEICEYIGVKLAPFTCRPTSKPISTPPASTTSKTSSKKSSTSVPTPTTTSSHSTLRTTTKPTSTTASTPTATPTTLSVYNGYVGAYCYNEGTSGRALNGSSYTDLSKMTIENCLDFCEKSGFGFAGVENSSEYVRSLPPTFSSPYLQSSPLPPLYTDMNPAAAVAVADTRFANETDATAAPRSSTVARGPTKARAGCLAWVTGPRTAAVGRRCRFIRADRFGTG